MFDKIGFDGGNGTCRTRDKEKAKRFQRELLDERSVPRLRARLSESPAATKGRHASHCRSAASIAGAAALGRRGGAPEIHAAAAYASH